uniref:Uncharacterized protein LOC114336093 n=1 Tax=Diabrotica virgifera virgifera TaxID=50390 RepID=A0A6P7GDH0_DIAVI
MKTQGSTTEAVQRRACNSGTSNKTENVKFHKFPSNKDLQKRWLIAIRSGKRISKHTKICSRHFSDENYTVTSLGKLKNTYFNFLHYYCLVFLGQWRILKKDVVPSLNLPKRKLDTQVKDSGRSRKRLCTTVLPLNKNNEQAETDIVQTENELVQSDTQKYGSETPSTENPSVSSKTSIKTQTVITLNRCQLIAYEFLSEEQLKHFTGFSRKLFRFFVEEFGKSYIKVHSALSVENELLITLMKYRKITAECGILELIQEGEFVLADRGFDISDLLEEKGVHLNIPPFKKGAQLSEEDIIKTRAIANHMEIRFSTKHLLTYRLNQDVLENLFGAIRAKGGLHDHPDSLQFKCRLRSYILLRNEHSLSSFGNVEEDETLI